MTDAATVEQRIAAKCRQFESRFRARQISAMVQDYYAPEAIMEGRDLPAQLGHEAIIHVFMEAREVCHSIRIDMDPITVIGEVAFGNITNRNTMLNGDVEIHRVLTIWQERNGDWFVLRDFFFSEQNLSFGDVGIDPIEEKIDPRLATAMREHQRQIGN